MTHHIEVPAHPQPPVCSCGWTPTLPWRVTWDQWDADAEAHLARFITCPRHGVQTRNAEGRCALCRNQGRTHD